jgi:hypothetical protein
LEQDSSSIPDDDDLDIDFTSPLAAVASVPVAALAPKDSEEGSGLASDDPSEGLSWTDYLQKVKECFIQAKPLSDVRNFAGLMPFRDWMDYVIKLMPKDIKVQGEVNFKHLVEEFGPIDKRQYQLAEPVQEAVFCEVSE